MHSKGQVARQTRDAIVGLFPAVGTVQAMAELIRQVALVACSEQMG